LEPACGAGKEQRANACWPTERVNAPLEPKYPSTGIITPFSVEERLLQNCFLYAGDDDDDDDGVDDDIEWSQFHLCAYMCLSWLLHIYLFLSCGRG